MSEALIIATAWPVVVLLCPERFDGAWVASLDRQVGALFARKEPFAFITDSSAIRTLPGAVERRALAAWASRPEQIESQSRWNVGSATIIHGTLMRGAMQALYWFWTPPCPQRASPNFDDAWVWSLAQLEKRGVALPTSARVMRPRLEREISERRERVVLSQRDGA